jgi:hypothetical protein
MTFTIESGRSDRWYAFLACAVQAQARGAWGFAKNTSSCFAPAGLLLQLNGGKLPLRDLEIKELRTKPRLVGRILTVCCPKARSADMAIRAPVRFGWSILACDPRE